MSTLSFSLVHVPSAHMEELPCRLSSLTVCDGSNWWGRFKAPSAGSHGKLLLTLHWEFIQFDCFYRMLNKKWRQMLTALCFSPLRQCACTRSRRCTTSRRSCWSPPGARPWTARSEGGAWISRSSRRTTSQSRTGHSLQRPPQEEEANSHFNTPSVQQQLQPQRQPPPWRRRRQQWKQRKTEA